MEAFLGWEGLEEEGGREELEKVDLGVGEEGFGEVFPVGCNDWRFCSLPRQKYLVLLCEGKDREELT